MTHLLRRVTPEHFVREQPVALPDVSEIIEDVRTNGDRALVRYAEQFGDLPPRRITEREIREASDRIDESLRVALEQAASRIEAFARAQRDALADLTVELPWGTVGHRAIAVRAVGAYVPAGRYPLPSTLLMTAIPARVAGVERIAVVTPRVDCVMLAAASLAGVTEVIQVGGAQAIAALAYGTSLVPRVDLIVGPGNRYVAAAKRAVFGICGIDGIAGASEVLIVASDDADPACVAADLLAQAEHDSDARALLIAESESCAFAIESELQRQLRDLPTSDVARQALESNGRYCIADLNEAPRLADAIGPEHLELHGRHAEALRDRVRAYGSLFVGTMSAEAFGDYGAGPNHVLPTAGTARFSAGLSVLTFLNLRTFQAIEHPERALVTEAARIARAEGLEAHARAAEARLAKGECTI